MESFCDHLGIILGPFWDYFVIIFESFFIVFWYFCIIFCYFWDHFVLILGSFWIVFLTFFDNFLYFFFNILGIILGSFWDHFGITLGLFSDSFWIFSFFESFGNGPGAILGYSLIVFGYIRPIPGPFSGKILKFIFPVYFPIYPYIYIYPHGVGGMGASPLN